MNNDGRKNMSPRPGGVGYGRGITGWFVGVSLGGGGGGRRGGFGGRGGGAGRLGGGVESLVVCGVPGTVPPIGGGAGGVERPPTQDAIFRILSPPVRVTAVVFTLTASPCPCSSVGCGCCDGRDVTVERCRPSAVGTKYVEVVDPVLNYWRQRVVLDDPGTLDLQPDVSRGAGRPRGPPCLGARVGRGAEGGLVMDLAVGVVGVVRVVVEEADPRAALVHVGADGEGQVSLRHPRQQRGRKVEGVAQVHYPFILGLWPRLNGTPLAYPGALQGVRRGGEGCSGPWGTVLLTILFCLPPRFFLIFVEPQGVEKYL